MIEVGVLGAAALFGMGLLTGWLLRGGEARNRPARPLSGPETPEESLARLTVMPKGSGFAPGPQPRARPGTSPAPPRGGGGVVPGRRGSSFPMKGGQVVMGPNQPRPQVQDRIPDAPPRGTADPKITGILLGMPPGMKWPPS